MPSKETDQRDQAVRGRALDAALAADREGRRRLVDQADEPPPASHGDPPRSRRSPGTREDDPL